MLTRYKINNSGSFKLIQKSFILEYCIFRFDDSIFYQPNTDKFLQATLHPDVYIKKSHLPKLHMKLCVGTPIPIRRSALTQSQENCLPLSPLSVPALMKAYLTSASKMKCEISHRSRYKRNHF